MENNQEEKGFFDWNPEKDLEDFEQHMQKPREPMPGLAEQETAATDDDFSGEQLEDSEASYLDVTEEQIYTAQLLLVQIDKVLAFGFSMFSGEDSERYRKRINKPQGEDYEATLLAALLKKYQARLTLEYMFLTAMVIAYLPEGAKALEDRKRNQLKKAEEAEKAKQQAIEEKAREMARANRG